MTGLAQWSLDKGLLAHVNNRTYQQYSNLIEPLIQIHKRYGSLEILKKKPQLWSEAKEQAEISERPAPLGPIKGMEQQPNHPTRQFERHPPPHDRQFRHPPKFDNRDHPQEKGGRPPRREDFSRGPYPEHRDRRPPAFENGTIENKITTTQPKASRLPLSIFNEKMEHIIGNQVKVEHREKIPVIVLGEIKGYIVYANRERLIDDYDLDISKEVSQYLWWIAGAMILLSASLAMPFSRLLIKPIRPIVDALHQLAKGNLKASVEINGKDEIAQVANDVNHLAATLAETEDSRKKWLANISHELRTPIAVMRGELEAMIDGVRKVDLDQIKSAHQETLHLQRLVEDLYQLTSSDIGALSYHKTEFDFVDILEDEVEHLEPLIEHAGHSLEFNNHIIRNKELWVYADSQRISQIIQNVVQNSIKYTQAPGRIKITLNSHNEKILLNIEDSAPTVKTDELEKIFDHLYRAEQSRNRSTGGSGLGLAICKKIVEGHSGTLTAKHSDLGGVKMIFTIPLINESKNTI